MINRGRVTPVHYAPPGDYSLGVELVRAAELRSRVGAVADRGVERVDFSCVIHVTGGRYEHTVDFAPITCLPGSCLILHPGQVHEFGDAVDWDGWMLIFRADLLPPFELLARTHELPPHIETSGAMRAAIAETFERMAEDAATLGRPDDLNDLLLSEVAVLLTRLHVIHASTAPRRRVEATVLDRYRAFRAAVEAEFRRWHRVADYASHLGWSTKTLARTTVHVADLPPKRIIVDRIVLEAKRLLAHTTMPVAGISEQLGFDEPTNFVKFFRREAAVTPGAFRISASS